MRIVAGTHRGRPISAPPGGALRPTADRVREAVFNSLCHGNVRIGAGDAVREVRVLDGFSGTGAMALEALSRGAAFATCIDIDRTALECCRANAEKLDLLSRMDILSGDCLAPVRPREPCSLIFLDPPYFQDFAAPALAALAKAGWIEDGALCVIETGAKEKPDWPEEAVILDQRKYGKALITFLRWRAA